MITTNAIITASIILFGILEVILVANASLYRKVNEFFYSKFGFMQTRRSRIAYLVLGVVSIAYVVAGMYFAPWVMAAVLSIVSLAVLKYSQRNGAISVDILENLN